MFFKKSLVSLAALAAAAAMSLPAHAQEASLHDLVGYQQPMTASAQGKTRADVVAEVRQARQNGKLMDHGEATLRTPMSDGSERSRSAVQAEARAAAQADGIPFGGEATVFPQARFAADGSRG